MHRNIQGILLDIDGTLIDSNEAHACSWLEALQEEGISRQLAEICPLIGMGGDHLLPKLLGISSESDQGKRLSKRKGEIFRKDYLSDLRPTPGAREFLVEMRKLGLKLGVATSASEEDLHGLLQVLQAEQLIPVKTNKTEAGASKPSPNVIDVALKKLGTFPGETLMLGDTAYDIEAALKVGVQTIALRCGGWSDEDLTGAVGIFDHPLDLLENLEFSPLASALLNRPSASERRSA